MIFIQKQIETPDAFYEAVKDITTYEALKDDARKVVIDLLLAEQGSLCAVCERKHSRFTPTIEHFLPKSFFPALQLAYHNLYVACQSCNEPKANHLIPSYIFDIRFHPFYNILENEKGFKPCYNLYDDNTCPIIVPAAHSNKNHDRFGAYLLQNTLDLMRQNRYTLADNMPPESSLLHQRAAIYKLIKEKLQTLTDSQLLAKYESMIQAPTYPEFVSLIVFLYAQEFRRRKITNFPNPF